MNHATLRERINRVRWYHAFEVAPGVVTPGQHPFQARSFLDSLGVPADLTGERVLDIGTWDGPNAFELEARGATVVALDVQDPNETGFNVARDILGSKVQYVHAGVYDLSRVLDGRFDRVFYFGVYYHLKHPVLGFEEIYKVMADDGVLYFEGECLRSYAETLDGRPITEGVDGIPVRTLADCDVPLTLCYPGKYRGVSNWFIPNFACIRAWMAGTGFEIKQHYFIEAPDLKPFPEQRVGVIARKAFAAVEEHPQVGVSWAV